MAPLSVLAAMFGMFGALLIVGYPMPLAATVSCLTTAAAVEVGCRLTAPFPVSGARVSVVVLVVVFVVTLICLQQPWTAAVGAVLGTAVPAAEIARRLTGHSYRLPRISY
jgi:hypothetical protein